MYMYINVCCHGQSAYEGEFVFGYGHYLPSTTAKEVED